MKLVAVGDNCMDVYDYTGQVYSGGNPVNVSVYFKRLGGESAYIGAVGNDKYGEIMIDSIKNKGVDISHTKVINGSTAITHVELVDGDRVFGDYDEGVLADFKLDERDFDFISKYNVFVTGLWGKVESDIKRIHDMGVITAFDSHIETDSEVSKIAITSTDYFFFSSDNGDNKELRDKMMNLKEKGPKVVICTLGKDGSIAYDGNKFYKHGIVKCNVIDTMGAGDSFIAGFLYGIMNEKSIEEAMDIGAKNSSVTIEYNGAW